eukprot:753557-Hanusia_phi.AAC.3
MGGQDGGHEDALRAERTQGEDEETSASNCRNAQSKCAEGIRSLGGELERIRGQVTRTRWYSTRMFFFDVKREDDDDSCINIVPFMLRKGGKHASGVLTAVSVVACGKQIQVGDEVEVEYFRDRLDAAKGERTMEVYKVETLKKASAESVEICAGADSEFPKPPPVEGHVSSLTALNRQPKGEICKFWVNSASCPLRNCTLKHVMGEERVLAKKLWQQERAEEKLQKAMRLAERIGDHLAATEKVPKRLRAEVFCRWLLDTFGKEVLASGSGVLDVAGGKGEISHKLAEAGIPSTVIDPRDCRKGRDRGITHVLQAFDNSLWNDPNFEHLLQNCSCVVGMHPDQATEPIVDFAIAMNKPFAVIPCCVFPKQSIFRTNQQSSDQDLVVTYEDFISYVQSKHPELKRHCLEFKGRNVVIFRT